MLVLAELGQQLEQLGRVLAEQLLGGEAVALAVILSVEAVLHQGREVALLVGLGVGLALGHQCHVVLPGLRVGLGMLHEVLKQGQGLGHVLGEAVQADADAAVAHVDVVVAGQLVELLLQLLVGEAVGAQVVEIFGSVGVADVGLVAKLIAEGELETAVLGVLDVDIGYGGVQVGRGALHFAKGQVVLEVDEARLDGLHRSVLNVLHEVAHQLAVGGDGGDLRLVNLLLVQVLALTLVDCHVVVGAQMALGKADDLLLGDFADAVEALHLLLPGHFVDEGIDEHAGAGLVAL